MKNSLKKLAQKAFAENQNLSELFATEDGNLFTKEANAKQHNRILQQNIHHFTRNEALKLEEVNTQLKNDTVVNTDTDTGMTEAEILDMSYADLKALAKELNIEVPDLKKESILSALKTHFKL